jgi:tRNA-dependent cyclodipeptide synthase
MNSISINKKVKVSFRSDSDMALENKRCVLLVSVGQKYHNDEKLEATINLINKSKFSSCLIGLADTLQRHNYPEKDDSEAYEYAHSMGTQWLEKHKNILEKLEPETNVMRWDDALKCDEYKNLKLRLKSEYDNNESFKNAYHNTINNFLDRFKKRDPNISVKKIFDSCLTYLIEECPIIMPLWASQGYDYVIYPKPMTEAMSMTYQTFVKSQYTGKGNWLSLKFK